MVSHAVSHSFISTAVEKFRDTRVASEVFKPRVQMPCAILFIIQVWQRASHRTCTQCVQMGHSHHGQILDWSDRASNTSFVCWKTNSRNYLCKTKFYFLRFQNLPNPFACLEALSTVSLLQERSKRSPSVDFNEFDRVPCSDSLKSSNAFSARGW